MFANPIFQPVVSLMIWTVVMWLWMYATRIPALGKAGVNPDDLVRDPAKSLDNVLPPQVQWKAHNYNHLHEAPTLFYAVCLVLVLTGNGGGWETMVAWAYVALRVVHSLIQASINKVGLRFAVFALSSFCLMALIFRAAQIVF